MFFAKYNLNGRTVGAYRQNELNSPWNQRPRQEHPLFSLAPFAMPLHFLYRARARTLLPLYIRCYRMVATMHVRVRVFCASVYVHFLCFSSVFRWNFLSARVLIPLLREYASYYLNNDSIRPVVLFDAL